MAQHLLTYWLPTELLARLYSNQWECQMRLRTATQTTTPTSWDALARYVLFEIPSAQELYFQLKRSSLTFPNLQSDATRNDHDLLFFPVVLHAFRQGKLPAFLSFIRLAKCKEYWPELRGSNQTQTTVIDVFLRDSTASISDAVRLLPLWMNIENEIDLDSISSCSF